MGVTEARLLRHCVVELVALAAEENRAAAQALQAMVTRILEPATQAVPRKSKEKAGATIHVGDYGSVVCEDYTKAGEYLGVSAATIQVKLSHGKGRYDLKRQDPDTGNPMLVSVVRGKGPETHARAVQALERRPLATVRKKTVITTQNRMRREPGVE